MRFGGSFHENVLLLHENTIRDDALIANSLGDGAAPWIGGRDAAELADQLSAIGRAISHGQIVRIISSETGRAVRYRQIPAVSWRLQLEAVPESGSSSAIDKGIAQHISALGAAFSQRTEPIIAPDPQALTAMLGHPPTFPIQTEYDTVPSVLITGGNRGPVVVNRATLASLLCSPPTAARHTR